MKTYEQFNNSAFGCWINTRNGRIFRFCAGIVFLTLGLLFYHSPWGIASLVWSFFPLTAGIFNICWISFVLGGPLSGIEIMKERNKS